MKNNETIGFQPRKRQDLRELLDRINALNNAITFKLELEVQIKLIKQKTDLLIKTPLAFILSGILFPNRTRIKKIDRKIEVSKLRTTNENNEKMKLKFHTNELSLETDLDDVKKEMLERYEEYLLDLKAYYNIHRFGKPAHESFPLKDVNFMVTKFESEPPKTNTEKLAFYLSMEELLYRCLKAQ